MAFIPILPAPDAVLVTSARLVIEAEVTGRVEVDQQRDGEAVVGMEVRRGIYSKYIH